MVTAKLVVNVSSECGKSRFRGSRLKNFPGDNPPGPLFNICDANHFTYNFNDFGPPNFKTCESDNLALALGEIEILFGSAAQWLSEKWLRNLQSGCLTAEILVVDEVHTVQTCMVRHL